MKIQEFEGKYNGQLVQSRHGILGQCVSVTSLWAEENGWQELWGNGDDSTAALIFQTLRSPDYEVVANTPDNFPAPGDLFFFGPTYGAGAGHTGVVVRADANTVTLFQQNDPEGSVAHEKTYNYNGAAGWFHPVKGDNMSTIVDQNIAADLAAGVLLREGALQTDPQYLNSVIGQPVETVLGALVRSDEHKAVVAKVNAYGDDQKTIALLNDQVSALQKALTAAKQAATTVVPQPAMDPLSSGNQDNSPTNNTAASTWFEGLKSWLRSIGLIK